MTDVRRYHAPSDGRLLGLLIPADFDAFAGREPHDDDRRAYVTDASLPLQVVVIGREPPWAGVPHVHDPLDATAWPTRHAVFLCVRGAARVDLYETDGAPAEAVVLGPGDALLVTEGHRVEVLEPGTRVLEVKQGPYLGEALDRRVLTTDPAI